jgi:hypothetical protein
MKLGLNPNKNNRATPSLSPPKRGEGGRPVAPKCDEGGRPGEGFHKINQGSGGYGEWVLNPKPEIQAPDISIGIKLNAPRPIPLPAGRGEGVAQRRVRGNLFC